jgi:hypothetical protein
MSVRALLLVLAGSALAAPFARAQCGEWTPGFARTDVSLFPAATTTTAQSIASFDAGAGARLFASDVSANVVRVGSWSGARWDVAFELTLIGNLLDTRLEPVVLGGVPQLVLVTRENGAPLRLTVRTWDGATVTQLGTLPPLRHVTDVRVFDDGSGEQLFVCGYDSVPGASGRVYAWNGAAWSQYGAAFATAPYGLTTFDDGAGEALYVCGDAGLVAGSSVARASGGVWTAVGALGFRTTAIESLDAGSGAVLHVVCDGLSAVPALHVLGGGSWTQVDTLVGFADQLTRIEIGGVPHLAFANSPMHGGPRTDVWTYDGSTLALVSGTGLIGFGSSYPTFVRDMAFVPDVAGGRLYAHGTFETVDGDYSYGLAVWDGAVWSTIGRGIGTATSNTVRALAAFDGGTGPQVWAAGPFERAGDARPLRFVTTLAPAGWTTGLAWPFDNALNALRVLDVGAGPRLFAAGVCFANDTFVTAEWDGNVWTNLGSGVNGDVYALGEFQGISGNLLVAGGNFGVAGGAPASRVAAWNGTSWSALGAGTDDSVAAFANFDEGSGPQLFAGGSFTSPASRIARWDGVNWSALGSGVSGGGVNALCVFDGQLYAGGSFVLAGGAPVSHIARWDGNAWSDVPGGGANGIVLALTVHDDGRGPALYAGGGFDTIGGITAYNVARFDGASWEAVAGGIDGVVNAFTSFDDDADGDDDLYVAGQFRNTATLPSGSIARLAGCPHYASFCAGDGSLADHTTACPCGNDGAAGHGCASGSNANGALLGASGSTQLDTVVLAGSGFPTTAYGLYLQHDAQDDRVFHDGVLCAGGNLLRLRNRTASGGASQFPDPAFAQDATLTLSQRGLVTPGSGATRYYSVFYRSPAATFCPPATANVTNGMRVIW